MECKVRVCCETQKLILLTLVTTKKVKQREPGALRSSGVGLTGSAVVRRPTLSQVSDLGPKALQRMQIRGRCSVSQGEGEGHREEMEATASPCEN